MEILKQIQVQFGSTLKSLFNKMGLITKGKHAQGEEAKAVIEKHNIKKELDSIVEESSTVALSNKEIDFILSKLRQANYTGVEFETFYIVFKKLGDMKK